MIAAASKGPPPVFVREALENLRRAHEATGHLAKSARRRKVLIHIHAAIKALRAEMENATEDTECNGVAPL
jgi:hypothetical protein